jgi:hypothetical protein
MTSTSIQKSSASGHRLALALGLFFLAPATAEYLTGYDSTTGNPSELFAGLLILAPLYGGPALIIRELARRTGRGWPTMLLLGLAFGLIEAGLVDHSLFNTSYRDIDYWQGMMMPTYIPALGISAHTAITFVMGHAIWSFCAPIAVIETFTTQRRTEPWLGLFGLAVVTILYMLAAALIFWEHIRTEAFLPSRPQLVRATLVVLSFLVGAFVKRGRSPSPIDRPAPSPWLVGATTFALLLFPMALGIAFEPLGLAAAFDSGWPGVLSNLAVYFLGIVLVRRWSRFEGWGQCHRLALAGGALLTNAAIAFMIEPIGDVAFRDKLLHNIAFAVGVALLLALAVLSCQKHESSLNHGSWQR